jgi:alkaline phosphatase D
MANENKTQTVVQFGDTFYLKNKSGQYLVAAEKGRYFFPRLDNQDGERLQLVGDTGELQHNDNLKIRSLETQLGDRDVLGAFPDSHNCYYWNDGYDERKQSWKITKANGKPGIIHYGDEVYLTNIYYDKQTLAADTKHSGYLTTVKNAKEVWILESTQKLPVTESIISKPNTVFDLSVASGDPTPTGVVLWTRINPETYQENLPLKYEVSRDHQFSNLVTDGTVSASDINEKTDYTVKVNLDKLEPNQRYFYRFIYDTETSPIGRCKTLPNENELIEKLRLAVITCNDYSTGYFNAFYHLAEEDIDFVVHLGDFVYEYIEYPPGYGEIIRDDLKLTNNEFPISDPDVNAERTVLLKDFRHVYRTYRQDPALQKAMENHTWIITLDDHEIADNCYWDYKNNTMDISVDEPLHPIYQKFDKGSDEAKQAMKQLYENATQVWSEYIPTSFQKTGEPPYKLYRHFRFGLLIDFFLTDSRSFRDKPNLEINEQILEKVKERQASQPDVNVSDVMKAVRQEMGLHDWQASMLGKEQKEWLINGVTGSDAKWKVWGNQTLLATAYANEWMGEIDDWHGFKAERYEILQAVKDSETTKKQGSEKISRFVVLTGDMHTSLIAYLKTDFAGIWNKGNLNYSKLAGVEFMTPSLTSPGISEGIYAKVYKEAAKRGVENPAPVTETVEAAASWALDGVSSLVSSVVPDVVEDKVSVHKAVTGNFIKRLSPHIEHFDSSVNGYAIAEFTKEKLQWYVYAINKTVYEKADDGRNLSTNRAEKKLVQSATYNPDGIRLDD